MNTSLGCRKCLIGILFDRKPDKLLSRTLYWTHVAAHAILKVREEDAMNALFIYRERERERERDSKLTGIPIKTLSRIKAELEKVKIRLFFFFLFSSRTK